MIYLVDFENTHNNGLYGIENLSPDDKVYIFVSTNSHSVNVLELAGSRTPVYFIRCMVNGCHDYMDFQIAATAGTFIARGEDVCIVSNDNGYSAVADFAKETKLFLNMGQVRLQKNLAGEVKLNVTEKPLTNKQIRRMMKTVNAKEIQPTPYSEATHSKAVKADTQNEDTVSIVPFPKANSPEELKYALSAIAKETKMSKTSIYNAVDSLGWRPLLAKIGNRYMLTAEQAEIVKAKAKGKDVTKLAEKILAATEKTEIVSEPVALETSEVTITRPHFNDTANAALPLPVVKPEDVLDVTAKLQNGTSIKEAERIRKAAIDNILQKIQTSAKFGVSPEQVTHIKTFIYDGNLGRKGLRSRLESVLGKKKWNAVYSLLYKHFIP